MRQGWDEFPLGQAPLQIIDGDRGKAYPKHGEFSDDGYCLFLSATNVTSSGFDFSECQFISEQKDEELRKGRLSRQDVVLTTRGTLGNVALYGDDVPYDHVRINSGMVIMRTNPTKLLPAFLHGFLRSPGFKRQVEQLRSGVAQPQLPIRDVNKIKLPLPRKEVQERIVTVLTTYDSLIENNLRHMKLLEESARLLYREWFVRLRFPGHEHTRIVNGVPEGWERAPLEEALVLQRGYDLPSQDRQEGTVPIYASTGPNGFHNKAMAESPGVVTGRSGTLGVVHYVTEDFWPLNTTLWVREFKKATPIYAFFMLQELRLEQYNGGVSVPTLDRKVVHRIPILIPSERLLKLLDEYVEPIFAQVTNLKLQNHKLKAARDLLLPKLMSGEIAV